MERTIFQKIKDTIFFPFRTIIFTDNKYGLTSLINERFDYVSKFVKGYCLDVGCGNNVFIKKYCNNNGIGIDLYKYEGLTDADIVMDLTKLPYNDESFETTTFIANVNHIPKPDRQKEISEAYRVTKKGGNIIITMGNPLAEIIVHKVIYIYDKVFKTNYDLDTIRGMEEEEEFFLRDKEILSLMKNAGYKNIKKKYFGTQWFFNHLFIGEK